MVHAKDDFTSHLTGRTVGDIHLFCLYAAVHLFIKYIVFSEKMRADNIHAVLFAKRYFLFPVKLFGCFKQAVRTTTKEYRPVPYMDSDGPEQPVLCCPSHSLMRMHSAVFVLVTCV